MKIPQEFQIDAESAMNKLAGVISQIQELESKIRIEEESLEAILDEKNRIEKEIRRNSRDLAAKNEELLDLRNMRESLMLKKGKFLRECEKEKESSRNNDSVERDTSPPRNVSTSRVDPSVPKTSLAASASSAPPGGGIAGPPTGIPYVVVENPNGTVASASSGIQVGSQVRWEYNGIKYYAGELRHMPMNYRLVHEYETMTSMFVTGLNHQMKESEAVTLLATCDGRWPPRSCGVLALQILRRASDESPEGTCINGGAFIRLANRCLAQAFLARMNGVEHRHRVINVQPCQEFQLRSRTRDPSLLGTQRFLRDVWNCPVEA